MSDYPTCKNTHYDHRFPPNYAEKYGGYCLGCDMSGVPALYAEIAALRAALKPFADEAAKRSWITNLSEKSGMDDMNIGGCGLTNGDLRRAAAALAPKAGG